jgi:GT2 family glycosyltransferase
VATQIFDVPLAQAHLDRPCDAGYGSALFILREGARPVGMVTVPVIGGQVSGWSVLHAIRPETLDLAAEVRGQARSAAPGARPITGTAAICTRERPDDLRRALTALTRMDGAADILVVDNAPVSDATRTVVAEFPRVRYVVEPAKGLDNARNRAMAETDADVVAISDDDAVVDHHWFNAILAPFERPDVAVVTGLTLPLELENDAQEEFEVLAGFSRRGFQRRDFRLPGTSPLSTGPIGAGANMAIRRSVLREIGPFDPALDAGTPTGSGGDHEFFSRVIRAGHTIIYDPAAMNRHRHRRTHAELISTMHGYGMGAYSVMTKALLEFGDSAAIRHAAGWFIHDQLPDLLNALTSSRSRRPLDVVLAELRGCAAGPFAFLRSRRAVRAAGRG